MISLLIPLNDKDMASTLSPIWYRPARPLRYPSSAIREFATASRRFHSGDGPTPDMMPPGARGVYFLSGISASDDPLIRRRDAAPPHSGAHWADAPPSGEDRVANYG